MIAWMEMDPSPVTKQKVRLLIIQVMILWQSENTSVIF